MLLVVDRQPNYFCVMGNKIDEARKFAIKHKGKPCEFNRATNDKEQGHVVGYNTRNGFIIVRVHKDFGWRGMDKSEDILVYTRFRIDRYSFYYVRPEKLIINERSLSKLSSKTSKRR